MKNFTLFIGLLGVALCFGSLFGGSYLVLECLEPGHWAIFPTLITAICGFLVGVVFIASTTQP